MYTTENKNKNHADNAFSFKSFFLFFFSSNDKHIYTTESKNIKILKITPLVSSSFSSNDKNKHTTGNRHKNPEDTAICFKFDYSSMISIIHSSPDASVIAATEDSAFLLTQVDTPDWPCMTCDHWTMFLSWLTVNEANFAVPWSQRDETSTICVDDSVTVLSVAKV